METTKKAYPLDNETHETILGPVAHKRHFRMEPPLQGNEYVVVSGTSVFGMPETIIFGADKDGEITDYMDLEGSFRGEIDHIKALKNAGYEIEK